MQSFPTLRSFDLLLAATLLVAAPGSAAAQSPGSLPNAPVPQAQEGQNALTLSGIPRDLLHEQAAIWTSPARIRSSNALLPTALVLATAVVITTDHQVMSSSRLQDASLNNHANTASTGLTGGFVAAPVILYGLGKIHRNDRATETGILGGEAMLNSLAVSEVMKFVSLRERPTIDGAHGRFFQTSVGSDSSFPSNHAVLAWSSAAVIASEYPGILTQITAYGLAAGVSATRVIGRDHFPSDVLVGSAVGWMIGRYVVHRHHHAD